MPFQNVPVPFNVGGGGDIILLPWHRCLTVWAWESQYIHTNIELTKNVTAVSHVIKIKFKTKSNIDIVLT